MRRIMLGDKRESDSIPENNNNNPPAKKVKGGDGDSGASRANHHHHSGRPNASSWDHHRSARYHNTWYSSTPSPGSSPSLLEDSSSQQSQLYSSSSFPVKTQQKPLRDERKRVVGLVEAHQVLLTKYCEAKRAMKFYSSKFAHEQRRDAHRQYAKNTAALFAGNLSEDSDRKSTGLELDSNNPSSPQMVRDEIVKAVAGVVTAEALRPVIFQVSTDSPPDKMTTIIQHLARSGARCESCGKKLDKKK